jgi:hypothetical protein
MINGATYQAARDVATTVENHFIHHLAAAALSGEIDLGPAPNAKIIEAIIDTAFWASLQREEGRSPKISLAFLPPEQAGLPLLFEQKLPLTPYILTKLAPGVERPGIHLGVWCEDDELFIWGATHEIQRLCFILDVSEPGLLVIKHRRVGGFGKFVNIAVLKGDQVKIVDEQSLSLPDCPTLLTSLIGFTTSSSIHDPVTVLVQLAVSMRAHGHGGTLLIVPSGTQTWRESIVHPISYGVHPAFSGLANLMSQEINETNQEIWQTSIRTEVDSMAGLTAVDGATIISDSYELLAFGAKIIRRQGCSPLEQIVSTEPIVGSLAIEMHPTHNGGTRHLSAAQFVHDQRNAIALVASQDGRFTIFAWSPCENRVYAHRVDALLL